MIKKCLVVGGGFAGLSAAVFLTKNSFKVDLIEASPKLGGRAYSFLEKSTNTIIDNGQHIFMGSYDETLQFLKLINAEKNLIYQQNLEVNFLRENFEEITLKSAGSLYPFNLILGLLNFKVISFSERLSLLRLLLKLPFITSEKLSGQSVLDWLKEENQNENIRKHFWDVIAIGALNTNTKFASAKIFVEILKKIFLSGNFAATIILPSKGLSETYVNNSVEFITKNSGRVFLSESLEEIHVENNSVIKIRTSNRESSDYNFIILAIPFQSLMRITGIQSFIPRTQFEYSTIVNIHIWLKQNNLEKSFYGLINSPVHWVFNKGTHLNLVISDANYLIAKSAEEIFELAVLELNRFLKIKREEITNYKVIKEKQATFIPFAGIDNKRPKQKTQINNLVFAGDWVDTGLPSTIESAVKSGRSAAELLIDQI
jgi:squalene-associated FAD-dependent desaturase